MKKQALIMMSCVILTGCSMNEKSIDVADVTGQMTLEEKVHFVIGTGMSGQSGDNAVVGKTKNLVPGAAGTTYPLERLSIPAIVLADGPAGLRIDAHRDGDSATYFCTHFPIGTLLACTWNEELVEEVGKSIGQEVKEYGADVLLAPALNIHRNPLNGRNFEYYSEDPLVAGKTAAAYVRGVQANGVGTSIKHFAANNQETNRMANNARISQRALREIYLKPFEIAVKESDPWTVMSSYNYLNGQYTSESKELLTTILRDEWGYKGTVMTDWFGGKDGAKQVWAGNDMLQPGKDQQFTDIMNGLKSDSLDEKDLDRNIGRILQLIEKTPRWNGYKYSNHPDLEAHAKVTRQSAVEGMVLLKNDNQTLPLDAAVKKVALYGCTSYDFIAGGTGSGNVNHAYVVSLTEGLKNAGYQLDDTMQKAYEDHIAADKQRQEEARKKDKNPYAAFMPFDLPPEMTFPKDQLATQAAASDVAVITIGRVSGEFKDRTSADFNLTKEERQLIEDITAVWHQAGKKVVVLLNIGGVIETASWKDAPDAILCAWQAGQEGGNSVADVLSGKASPSGKLTMTWPVAFTDHASSANFPVDKTAGLALGGSEKKSDVKDVDFTNYEEDVFVGYRYFDSFGKEVSYPFGYGLSYTTFEYADGAIKDKGDAFEVTVKVKNAGKVKGKEVVQVYVIAPNAQQANKPEKELKAFAKTKSLEPGEEEALTMRVKKSDLASFDEANSQWKVDAGEYSFLIASSSRDVKNELKAKVEASVNKVNDVLKLDAPLNRLHR